MPGPIRSSTNVFHSWQCGQRHNMSSADTGGQCRCGGCGKAASAVSVTRDSPRLPSGSGRPPALDVGSQRADWLPALGPATPTRPQRPSADGAAPARAGAPVPGVRGDDSFAGRHEAGGLAARRINEPRSTPGMPVPVTPGSRPQQGGCLRWVAGGMDVREPEVCEGR
jgi:hypothetical protein